MTLAAALILGIQSQPAALTHSFGVMRADLLIKAVSDRTGWKLEGDSSLRRDYVYASVKDLTKEQAKSLLARLLEGQWVKSGQEERLVSSVPVEDADEALRRAVVEQFFKDNGQEPAPFTSTEAKDIIKQADELQQGFDAGSQEAVRKRSDLLNRLPYRRALTSVATALGKDFWMGLKKGQRVVFSENPTPMQRPLPPAAAAIASRLRDELTLFAAAIEQFGQASPDGRPNSVTGMYRSSSAQFGALEAAASWSGGQPYCVIRVTDTRGQAYRTMFQQPMTARMSPPSERSLEDARKCLPGVNPSESIVFSERLKAIAQALASQGQAEGDLPPEILEAAANPEKQDILDLTMAEPLDALARRMNKGLLALVPDDAWRLPASGRMSFADLGLALSKCRYHVFPAASASEGQNVAVGVSEAGQVRAGRFDREASGRLFRGLMAGKPRIDLMSDYCLSGPAAATDRFVADILRISPFRAALPQDGSRLLLRIYGRLPDSLKKQAASGGAAVTASGLPPASQADLASLVYGFCLDLRLPGVPDPLRRQPLPDGGAQDAGAFGDPFAEFRSRLPAGYSVLGEPTRALGSGIPGASTLAFSLASKPVWFGQDTQALLRRPPQPVSLRSLATALVYAEKGAPGSYGSADAFYLGSSTCLSARLLAPSGAEASQGYVVDDPQMSGRYTIESLPADARAALDRALASVRETYRNVNIRPAGASKSSKP